MRRGIHLARAGALYGLTLALLAMPTASAQEQDAPNFAARIQGRPIVLALKSTPQGATLDLGRSQEIAAQLAGMEWSITPQGLVLMKNGQSILRISS